MQELVRLQASGHGSGGQKSGDPKMGGEPRQMETWGRIPGVRFLVSFCVQFRVSILKFLLFLLLFFFFSFFFFFFFFFAAFHRASSHNLDMAMGFSRAKFRVAPQFSHPVQSNHESRKPKMGGEFTYQPPQNGIGTKTVLTHLGISKLRRPALRRPWR